MRPLYHDVLHLEESINKFKASFDHFSESFIQTILSLQSELQTRQSPPITPSQTDSLHLQSYPSTETPITPLNHHSHGPTQPLVFHVNTAPTPQLFAPLVTSAPETEITDDATLWVTPDVSTTANDAKLKELYAEDKDQEVEPVPQKYRLVAIIPPSPPPSLDDVPTLNLSGSRLCSAVSFLAADARSEFVIAHTMPTTTVLNDLERLFSVVPLQQFPVAVSATRPRWTAHSWPPLPCEPSSPQSEVSEGNLVSVTFHHGFGFVFSISVRIVFIQCIAIFFSPVQSVSTDHFFSSDVAVAGNHIWMAMGAIGFCNR